MAEKAKSKSKVVKSAADRTAQDAGARRAGVDLALKKAGFTSRNAPGALAAYNKAYGTAYKSLDEAMAPSGNGMSREEVAGRPPSSKVGFLEPFEGLPVVGDVVRGAKEVLGRPGDLVHQPLKYLGAAAAGAAPFLAGPLGKPLANIIGTAGHLAESGIPKNPLNLLPAGLSLAGGEVGGDLGKQMQTGAGVLGAGMSGNPAGLAGAIAPVVGGGAGQALGLGSNLASILQMAGRGGVGRSASGVGTAAGGQQGAGGTRMTANTGREVPLPQAGGDNSWFQNLAAQYNADPAMTGQNTGLYGTSTQDMAPPSDNPSQPGQAGGGQQNIGQLLGLLSAIPGLSQILQPMLASGLLAGSGGQQSAMQSYLMQALMGTGGLNSLFQAPNDQGHLGQASALTGAPEQNLLQGFASTGGVNLQGTSDPYALLPHQQEQLNQHIDELNEQRKKAAGDDINAMVKRGLNPETAKLVAAKVHQHYDGEIQKARTNFMETNRQNRQNTYAQLFPMLGQMFGQQTNLANQYAGLDATKQANLRTLLGMAMGTAGYRNAAGGGGQAAGGSGPGGLIGTISQMFKKTGGGGGGMGLPAGGTGDGMFGGVQGSNQSASDAYDQSMGTGGSGDMSAWDPNSAMWENSAMDPSATAMGFDPTYGFGFDNPGGSYNDFPMSF